jgi:hypothetical protein
LRLTLQRPSHPAPNVRDDREPPLLWERDSENCKFDLGLRRSEIFLQRGLDRFSARLPVGQIAFVSGASGPADRSSVRPATAFGLAPYLTLCHLLSDVRFNDALHWALSTLIGKPQRQAARFGQSTLVRSLGSDHLGPILVSNSIAFCRCRFAPIC